MVGRPIAPSMKGGAVEMAESQIEIPRDGQFIGM
jgi:hypothetical protein